MLHTSKETLKKKSSLKVGDEIIFKGLFIKYFVYNGSRGQYQLNTGTTFNASLDNAVYSHFNLVHAAIASIIGYENMIFGGRVPVIKGIENMRKLIVHIFEIIEKRNYTNLIMSPAFISFLKNNIGKDNVCQILFRERNKLDDSGVNYIDIENEGNVSFMPKGKIQAVTENGEWIFKGRQIGKPSKIIRNLIPKNILSSLTDSDFEKFSNIFKSGVTKDGDFKIVSGTDIKKYYKHNTYVPNQGTLSNSCMRYDSCQGLFKVYIDNPDTIKMLIQLDSNDRIYGRALLWYDELGNKIMDRIYGSDLTVEKFRNWARKNGYYFKNNNNSTIVASFTSPNGETYIKFFKIRIKPLNHKSYPYIDTFSNMNHGFDYLTNGQPLEYYSLRNTGGDLPYTYKAGSRDGLYVTTLFSGLRIFIKKQAIYFEDIGYESKENVVTCEHSKKLLMKQLAVKASDDKWYDRDFVVRTHEGNNVYIKNPKLVKTEDGIYSLISNTFICSKDGKRYHKKDKVIGKNKKPFHINNLN